MHIDMHIDLSLTTRHASSSLLLSLSLSELCTSPGFTHDCADVVASTGGSACACACACAGYGVPPAFCSRWPDCGVCTGFGGGGIGGGCGRSCSVSSSSSDVCCPFAAVDTAVVGVDLTLVEVVGEAAAGDAAAAAVGELRLDFRNTPSARSLLNVLLTTLDFPLQKCKQNRKSVCTQNRASEIRDSEQHDRGISIKNVCLQAGGGLKRKTHPADPLRAEEADGDGVATVSLFRIVSDAGGGAATTSACELLVVALAAKESVASTAADWGGSL